MRCALPQMAPCPMYKVVQALPFFVENRNHVIKHDGGSVGIVNGVVVRDGQQLGRRMKEQALQVLRGGVLTQHEVRKRKVQSLFSDVALSSAATAAP